MTRRSKGFSLLEILVAFAILSISLGALLAVFGQGLTMASNARHYAEAAVIAESRLAEIGSARPLEVGDEQGESGTYQWDVRIEPYEWPEEDVDPAILNDNALTPLRITIRVAWRRGVREQFIELESLMLKGT